jgi:hypothetical protein
VAVSNGLGIAKDTLTEDNALQTRNKMEDMTDVVIDAFNATIDRQ